jgi:hypothetical protein
MLVMLVLSFFSWWYGLGWIQVAKSFRTRLTGTLESFSVTQLMRTLFSPWRRIITYPGASLADRMRAWGDNLFSRVMGFIVRLFVLVGALVAVVVIAIFSLLAIIIWPLLPLAIPGCLIAGLR